MFAARKAEGRAMFAYRCSRFFVLACAALGSLAALAAVPANDGKDDLSPLADSEWNRAHAAHLLERAGFGGTPQQIQALAAMGVTGAVRHLVLLPERRQQPS
jgi:hypothetical protein